MTHKNRFCCSYVTLRSHKKLQCTHISYGKLLPVFCKLCNHPDFMKYKKSISWSKFQRFGSGHFCHILTRRNDLNRLRIEPCINHSCMIKTRFCDFLTKVAVFLLTMEFLRTYVTNLFGSCPESRSVRSEKSDPDSVEKD